MTNKQLQAALDKIGLSQRGMARLLAVDERSARRWASGDAPIPECAAILLRLLLAKKITVEDIEAVRR